MSTKMCGGCGRPILARTAYTETSLGIFHPGCTTIDCPSCADLRAQLAAVTAERDEARERIAVVATGLDAAIRQRDKAQADAHLWTRAENDKTIALSAVEDQLAAVTAQRDAALHAATLLQRGDSDGQEFAAVVSARIERDEARGALATEREMHRAVLVAANKITERITAERDEAIVQRDMAQEQLALQEQFVAISAEPEEPEETDELSPFDLMEARAADAEKRVAALEAHFNDCEECFECATEAGIRFQGATASPTATSDPAWDGSVPLAVAVLRIERDEARERLAAVIAERDEARAHLAAVRNALVLAVGDGKGWENADGDSIEGIIRDALEGAPAAATSDPCWDGTTVPLGLLAKLASGEGGRRTGMLKQLGYITWEVTPAGHAAINKSLGIHNRGCASNPFGEAPCNCEASRRKATP